jgi:hypothetical protein
LVFSGGERPVRFWAAIVRSGRSFTQPGRGLERLAVVGSGTAALEKAQGVSCLSFKLSWWQVLNERISPALHVAVDEYDDAQCPLVVHLRLAVTFRSARRSCLICSSVSQNRLLIPVFLRRLN